MNGEFWQRFIDRYTRSLPACISMVTLLNLVAYFDGKQPLILLTSLFFIMMGLQIMSRIIEEDVEAKEKDKG